MRFNTGYIFLRLFLFFSISISYLSVDASTWNRIPKTNWENSMGHSGNGMCIEILPDNILRIHVNIGMATDDISSFPQIGLEYDFGGYETGLWTINSSDIFPENINGYNAFAAKRMFTIDLNGLCSGHNIPTHNSPSPFAYSFDIVRILNNNQTELYPVLDYPDLFPPEMFPELDDPDFSPEYSGVKNLCCITMTSNRAETSEEVEHSESTDSGVQTASLFPNPAQEEIAIQFYVSNSNFYRIDVLDVNGRVIDTIYRKINKAGVYDERINIQSYQSGIFYCRISSSIKNEIIKFAKI